MESRIDALEPSWNTLDTVYHEGTHGIQEQLGQIPGTYITPNMDWELYRIQGIEKEAYAAGQSRTLQALADYEQATGKFDSARLDYFAAARNDSFQNALSDAARHYNDPNIEQTLAAVIQDREDNVVRSNASESYQAIYDLCETYGIHSSADLSSSPEAVSALTAAQPEPTPPLRQRKPKPLLKKRPLLPRWPGNRSRRSHRPFPSRTAGIRRHPGAVRR